MKFEELKKSNIYGALVLEDIISHGARRRLLAFLGIIIILSFGAYSLTGVLVYKGSAFIFLALFLKFIAIEAYFYSKYKESFQEQKIIFPLAEILFYADADDLVRGFIFSETGFKTLRKLGLSASDIKNYLIEREEVNISDIKYSFNNVSGLAENLLQDNSFKNFLLSKSIPVDDFIGALNWEIEDEEHNIDSQKWWSRENLGGIQGIAKDWAYGETYLLEKIARNVEDEPTSHPEALIALYKNKVLELERILSKSSGANAIVVSSEGANGSDLVSLLSYRIQDGMSTATLQHKKIFIVDTAFLFESSADTKEVVKKLFEALVQALKAHNTIVCIPDFIPFMERVKKEGDDVASLIKPLLESPFLHLIFLESTELFDKHQDEYGPIISLTDVVRLNSGDNDTLTLMLKREARKIENSSGVVISFPAIIACIDSARRFFSGFEASEKARNLLIESVPFVLDQGKKVVTKQDILLLSEQKTGIPSSDPSAEEKTKLISLETDLHKRVIGQDEAIKSISNALRRSRAGVTNPKRPIGSFLFLGPTGVGKTETAKALAEIMFKDEEKLSRLDMSEYQGVDALSRLIGDSFNNGSLASILLKKPYGVLLLDEFEKATREIHNLFLQVLDEGFFTTGNNKKINARENIFIATSNAGSEIIWDLVAKNEDISSSKDFIINELIKSRIFSPELLNRFDGIILFAPLSSDDLKKVARIMLSSLSKRLEEKAINIDWGDDVINLLVEKGSDKKFGARAMRRMVSEVVEDVVAQSVIKGEISSGMKAVGKVEGDSVKLEVL